MPKTDLFAPLHFTHGPTMKNRFMLAPLTNTQSHADGTLSDEEFRWLTMRAQGGFGLTMTCAAHVQAVGQGFAGQLGIFADAHIPGLTRLATAIKANDSIALVQLHHAGMRTSAAVIGQAPVGPSADEKSGTRALSEAEVQALIEDFILAALRAERAGFDGVELHGAHGYILSAFLSPQINQRSDAYGGSPQNRARIIHAVIAGIRARCRADFILGLRLSPERFGQDLGEIRDLAQQLMTAGALDFIDMSLWDVTKQPTDPRYQGRSLMSYFTDLDRGSVKLGVAGKLSSAQDVRDCFAAGCDFVLIGRAAILHHDYPQQIARDGDFVPVALPVSKAHLQAEGVSAKFIEYLKNWPEFVAD